MRILVTGAAGFIGYHLVEKLVKKDAKFQIVGLDNINDYYNLQLKKDRLSRCGISSFQDGILKYSTVYENYSFIKMDIRDSNQLDKLFCSHQFNIVINLAAQAGVRYSLTKPEEYISNNISGFLNILECCRNHSIKHLLYASSSSVYGLSDQYPFSEKNNTDIPANLYGVTKKTNELMAFAYGNLYKLPTTGLRFFSVYGPWGRPDMALMIFTKAILNGSPIEIYNQGEHSRAFTYIDDIVFGIEKLLTRNLNQDKCCVYNLGSSTNVNLLHLIAILEKKIGNSANRILCPIQKGDIVNTSADISKYENEFGIFPLTSIEDGVNKYLDWYKEYYKVKF